MVEYRTKYERELENKMGDKEFSFQNKRRVVVKIGSSSLNHAETGNLNLTKVEHLVRELCDMRNRGIDVCLVSQERLRSEDRQSDLQSARRISQLSRRVRQSDRQGS